MLILLVAFVSLANGQDKSINGCGPGTIPQYALLVDSDISNGHKSQINQVTRTTCAHFCNINRDDMGKAYSCKAFGYKEEDKTCFLYDEQTYDRGVSNATSIKGILVFEKMCLTASQTCTIIPAFERRSNHILNGFTQVVLDKILSEEACLSACLRSKETHDFQCMSTMYYYETRECLLNFDSKVTPGVSEYFSNETENYSVDYYDNLCALRKRDMGIPFNACPDHSTPTFFRYNSTELPQFDVISYPGLSLSDCLKRCNEAENLTCNSVNYSPDSCALSFVDHRVTPESNLSKTLNHSDSTVHYERSCIEGARLVCGDDNRVAFDVVPNVRMPAEFLIVALSGISPEECLSLCLLDPSNRCRSVNYESKASLCQLNNATRLDGTLLDAPWDAQVVYYENMCHPGNVVVEPLKGLSERLMDQLNLDSGNETDIRTIPTPTLPNMEMQPICEYSDMRVRMVAERPFTGFFFAKNKFGTCRVDVENRAEMVLALKFPDMQNPESPCGVSDIGPNKYSVIVVVTANNMDIPGLVTETDRFFNITCDFTSSISNLVTATGHSIAVNNPTDTPGLYPDGMVVIPSPLNIILSRPNAQEAAPGARGTREVRTAQLGEQLNLDFHYYPGFNRTGLGLFVRQCNASRHSGPPPEPATLVLLDDGCPTPAAKGKILHGAVSEIESGFRLPFIAFRFDGSNSVKISCAIDMCEKGCHPIKCPIDGQQVASFGKRRRRSIVNRNGDHQTKTESSSIIFTVVDKLTPFTHETHTKLSNTQERMHLIKKLNQGYLEHFVTYDSKGTKRQVCLKRATFLGVSAFLSVVCFAQVVTIATYVAYQYVGLNKRK